MTDNASYRSVMGERLKEFRESLGLSAYKVAQRGGIRIDQVKAVEDGATNYTIDVFLGYIRGCDLYMYFADKSPSRNTPHDLDDLAQKAVDNKPQ